MQKNHVKQLLVELSGLGGGLAENIVVKRRGPSEASTEGLCWVVTQYSYPLQQFSVDIRTDCLQLKPLACHIIVVL